MIKKAPRFEKPYGTTPTVMLSLARFYTAYGVTEADIDDIVVWFTKDKKSNNAAVRKSLVDANLSLEVDKLFIPIVLSDYAVNRLEADRLYHVGVLITASAVNVREEYHIADLFITSNMVKEPLI